MPQTGIQWKPVSSPAASKLVPAFLGTAWAPGAARVRHRQARPLGASKRQHCKGSVCLLCVGALGCVATVWRTVDELQLGSGVLAQPLGVLDGRTIGVHRLLGLVKRSERVVHVPRTLGQRAFSSGAVRSRQCCQGEQHIFPESVVTKSEYRCAPARRHLDSTIEPPNYKHPTSTETMRLCRLGRRPASTQTIYLSD